MGDNNCDHNSTIRKVRVVDPRRSEREGLECGVIDLSAIIKTGGDPAPMINTLVDSTPYRVYSLSETGTLPQFVPHFISIILGDNPIELMSCNVAPRVLCISRRAWAAIGGFPHGSDATDPKRNLFAETVNRASRYRVFQSLDLVTPPEVPAPEEERVSGNNGSGGPMHDHSPF